MGGKGLEGYPEDALDYLEDTLDALEMMVGQYLRYDNDPEDFYNHAFMSAGERACWVLCNLRPDRWRETPCGMEFIGDDN